MRGREGNEGMVCRRRKVERRWWRLFRARPLLFGRGGSNSVGVMTGGRIGF